MLTTNPYWWWCMNPKTVAWQRTPSTEAWPDRSLRAGHPPFHYTFLSTQLDSQPEVRWFLNGGGRDMYGADAAALCARLDINAPSDEDLVGVSAKLEARPEAGTSQPLKEVDWMRSTPEEGRKLHAVGPSIYVLWWADGEWRVYDSNGEHDVLNESANRACAALGIVGPSLSDLAWVAAEDEPGVLDPDAFDGPTAGISVFFGTCWTVRWSETVCPTCWRPTGPTTRVEGEKVLYVAWVHVEGWLTLKDGATKAKCMVEAYEEGCCADEAYIDADMLMLNKTDAEKVLAAAEVRGMKVRKDAQEGTKDG